MNDERRPESADALDAVEAVIRSAPKAKHSFLESYFIPCKDDSPNERRRKIILDICMLIIFLCVLVILWVSVVDPLLYKHNYGGYQTAGDPIPVTTQTVPEGQTQPPTQKQTEPEKPHLSHEKLLELNSDYMGWLKAPGAEINMPLVQTENNNYYLYRNFERKPSRYGNPFLDYRVTLDPMSSNLIIYGHHMSNGTIFTKLTRYQQTDVVKKYPIITMELPERTYQFKVMSVLVINGRPSDDNGYVFQVNTPDFPGPESFDGYIRQIKQRTLVNTGVDAEWGDILISLQTCIYDFKDEYLYVIGRMVRPGEAASIPADQIKKNPNPRVPQALCDKYSNGRNAFKNAERWEAPR